MGAVLEKLRERLRGYRQRRGSPRLRGMIGGLPGLLVGLIAIAVVGVAVGVALGGVDLINKALNGTLTIPQPIQNSLGNFGNIAGAAITIAAVVILLGVIFYLVYWARSMSM